MSETKFTKGPWKKSLIGMDVEISANTPEGNLSVCWVHIGQGAELSEVKSALSDADLISAAPELYEALKNAAAVIVSLDAYSKYGPVKDQMAAALAKADGAA